MYAPAAPADDADGHTQRRGVGPQTVRSTLTTFSAVVQSYVDQGVLPRNVIPLVERPKDADPDDTRAERPTPRHRGHRQVVDARRGRAVPRVRARSPPFACWLLSCYGLRRSEVLGLRWSAVDLDTGMLSVRRGRVAVGGEAVEGAPKSRRSRRDLPLPAELTEALRALRQRQRTEAMALGRRVVG